MGDKYINLYYIYTMKFRIVEVDSNVIKIWYESQNIHTKDIISEGMKGY